jgi:hypothetical protein
MTPHDICTWIQSTGFATAIRESNWLFATIECVHVFAIAVVVGTVVMVDLRLLGFGWRDRAVTELTTSVLPVTWCAFVVAVLSGGCMFTSHALKYYNSIPFRIKMACLLLAGFNMMLFHQGAYRSVNSWDRALPPIRSARIAGALSILLWIAVVASGRMIGFVK